MYKNNKLSHTDGIRRHSRLGDTHEYPRYIADFSPQAYIHTRLALVYIFFMCDGLKLQNNNKKIEIQSLYPPLALLHITYMQYLGIEAC